MTLRRAAAGVALAITCATAATAGSAAAAEDGCPAPTAPMTFAPQGYVEMERAGGEPTITTLPDGTLLYGAHAGTTHFYTPYAADPTTLAFGRHYEGQTYIWRSADNGATWEFIDRALPGANLDPNAPGSGFSDPEWAIDAAGQVYTSEINLVNVAVSKSGDGGRTFALQNFFGNTVTDRQWKAADQKDELYLVSNALGGGTFPNQPVGNAGHYLYKSVDGGRTFSPGLADGAGLGDIQVDPSDGTLYETYYAGGRLQMAAYRDLRGEADISAAEPEVSTIAEDVDMGSHWPSFALDAAGNLYATWDERGRDGGRPAGIYYAFSTDRGATWSAPTRVDAGDNTKIWPWLAVGDTGRVAIAWLEADAPLPGHDAEQPGDHAWRVVAAQTHTGLGCAGSDRAGFAVAVMTPDPVHTGTICEGGTICQAQAVDRRLGDFFTISIDGTGHVWAGYSDTREGGGVALPGLTRQAGGPRFTGAAGPGAEPPAAPAGPQAGGLRVRTRIAPTKLRNARRVGVRVLVRCSRECAGRIVARVDRRNARRLGLGRRAAPIGRAGFALPRAGRASVTVRLTRRARRGLRRVKAARILVTARAAGADPARTRRTIR